MLHSVQLHVFTLIQAHREEIVIVNYELNANPADHKSILPEQAGHHIS